MLHYYLNLPKDNPLAFDSNVNVSNAILHTARKSFEPFERYIQNVITVLENKEAIQATWKEVNSKNIAQLSIIGWLYEIPKETIYRIILKEGDNPDFNEKLKYKAGIETGEISISKEDFQNKKIRLPIETETIDKVIWGFNDVKLELVVDQKQRMRIPQGITIRDEKHRRIIYSEKKNDDFNEIKKFESFITDYTLCFEDGSKFDEEREGRIITFKDSKDYDNIVDSDKFVTANNIKFHIKKLKNNKEAFRIQLEEIDKSDKDDDIQTSSPLRYFFDDDISIEDENRNQYSVIDGRESENTLILKNKKDNNFDRPKSDIIKVRVNTYQLKKQLEAVTTLKNMPAAYHSSLIKLFENRDKVRWDNLDNKSVDEWYVITDTNRSGCDEQRDFVNKAINTKDFAILEGPPGSGKTTVILELICQLAKQNKRVMLCGSTHVAIDNILERLKEKSFLEKFHILPVRIGDEKRINEDIHEFQIKNLVEDNAIDEDLLLSAANLVCGTTIGILQHPKFKKRKGDPYTDKKGRYQYSSYTPIIPEFDCLIIDESSKTTFQEFLVPALYAKKWILAGDVMQLSPFTERENIVSNIENLTIDGKPLPKDLQYAVFYLQKLKDCVRYGGNRFVLPVSAEISKKMYEELTCKEGRINDFQNKIILFITENTTQNENHQILVRSFENINFLEIAVADIIFVDENYLLRLLPSLSERHAVLRSDLWKESKYAFIHNEYQNRHNFSYREKGQEFKNSFDIVEHINHYLKDRNWAEEVAWRIDREYQLRRKENKTKKNMTQQIEELIPKSIDGENVGKAVNSVAEMAFPSILESLVQGVKGRRTGIESTISEGFKKDDLNKRKTKLVYQHRMHSEISKFPRERFYTNENEIALKDIEMPSPIDTLRKWTYKRYPSRSVWVNVDGETNRNYNLKEVDVLMEHLNGFIQYAKINPPPEKKEWEVACLAFYRGQETHIREKLQALFKKENGISNFSNKENNISVKLHTVDKFQGHEADVVFLSMVQTNRVGFMDNPNRLNVAITRAKFQLVIFGKHEYFLDQNKSDDLKELAQCMPLYKG